MSSPVSEIGVIPEADTLGVMRVIISVMLNISTIHACEPTFILASGSE